MMCISAIYVKECLKFSLKSRNIQEGLQIKDEPHPKVQWTDVRTYSSLFTHNLLSRDIINKNKN
jgi:hypothetical protein